ncbi:MAG TPA: hypothetical protein VMQ51_08025 [Candidatus Binatia bacterium]|nr:hypothetical protein [Candidatus Binatia bacterium]
MSTRLEIRGVSRREAAALRADARIARALAALAPGAGRALVVLSDDNGPKGGPAVRCAVTVSVPRRGGVHVETRALSARLALAGALDRLRRRLVRTASTARAARRRPKKYYVARTLTG